MHVHTYNNKLSPSLDYLLSEDQIPWPDSISICWVSLQDAQRIVAQWLAFPWK